MSSIPGQIDLVAEEGDGVDTHRPTRADLGLRKLAPGPERLLGALLRHGLAEDDLGAAARLVLALDERASG